MYLLRSYLSTFVCFSIMVVRIRFKMYNQLIRIPEGDRVLELVPNHTHKIHDLSLESHT